MSNENDVIRYDAPQHEAYGTDRMPHMEPFPARRSVYRRRSFINEFVRSNGPPQIIVLIMLLAFGFGSIVGVVPAVRQRCLGLVVLSASCSFSSSFDSFEDYVGSICKAKSRIQ